MKYILKTVTKKILADTLTPVSIYLKIRDRYPNSLLLESSDYHANDNSFSYICFNPLSTIKLHNETLFINWPDGHIEEKPLKKEDSLPTILKEYAESFESEKTEYKFINNGLFGYLAYDAVRYFEDIRVRKKTADLDIPDMFYAVYQNIIAIDHFKNQAFIFSHSIKGEPNIEAISQLLKTKNYTSWHFKAQGKPDSVLTDSDYKKQVALAKKHCQRGDVFQLVLSRRFSQKFAGDEFNVYRALRSVNPSPYLFYFDYGNFKIFGSSPEAQLIIKNRQAEIHPIAGTFKRTGNDLQDAELAKKLTADTKENSEHVMLVDLARNDLSRHGRTVKVETYREVQFFSHVIHLVSKVTGKMNEAAHSMQVVADTFPAGTLSGAPKHRAMQLIEKYEKHNRSFYGGALGFMDFKGNFNHAIMIRTFLSKNHQLHYQAGAGLVSESDAETELQETYNKLGALQKALKIAEDL